MFCWALAIICVFIAIACIFAIITEAKNQKELDKKRRKLLDSLYDNLVSRNITEHIEQLTGNGHIFLDHYKGDKLNEIYVIDYFPRKEEYQVRIYRPVWETTKKGTEKHAKMFVNMMASDVNDVISFLDDKFRIIPV